MRAASVIGRVGGLAVALGIGAGIGAAALGGSAVAWADASDSSAAHASSARSTATHAGPKAAATHKAQPAAVSPAAISARAISALPASVTTAVRDSSSGGSPAAPTQPATDLTVLAYTRRELTSTAHSARTTLPAASTALQTPTLQSTGAPAAAAQNIGIIMGPSGVPVPTENYILKVYQLYVQPNSPNGTIPIELTTPEGLYPITGVKSLPLNISVTQGIASLQTQIDQQIVQQNSMTIFGYSQSAIISSLIMNTEPTSEPINFVLVGNEMNPNGGFLSRFPGLTLPSLGLTFYGATPNDRFPVVNYTQEYDGFADFPKYPLNFLADLNAGLGIVFVHTKYADLTQQQVDQAILLPSSSPTQKYYIIPTQNLPLLEPLRLIPLIGNPLADLLQPALKVIVNLGYGSDPYQGWSSDGFADQLHPFEFLPNIDVGEVVGALVAGVQQGIHDFVADFQPGGSFWQEMSSIHLPTLGPIALPTTPDGIITAIQNVTTSVASAISNAAASLYAALLPTADIVNAIVTMLPAYNVTLFLDGIQQAIHGDPINGLLNAFGRPLAADVGLVTTAGLIEFLVVAQAIAGAFGVQPST